MLLLFAVLPSALAASLDNLEIGGPWGSPTATDGSAAWWNPGAVAAGKGTRLLLEGAPTFATIGFDRADPAGGEDKLSLVGAVPFVGLATDAGVKGLGLSLTLAVPFVRGGNEVTEPGPGSHHLRQGMVQGIYLMAGGGWNFFDRVSVGAMGGVLRSSWKARVDNDTMVLLSDAITAMGEDAGYTDDLLESPDYAATLDFDNLTDTRFVWSAGIRAQPIDRLSIGLAWIAGAAVENTGRTTIAFGCPPQSDTTGRFGAESYGICDVTMTADAMVGYTLPSRLHGGIGVELTPAVHLEVMAGWVRWSQFKDYKIVISGVDTYNELSKPETADLVNQTRLWARENHDSGWGAIDVKGRVSWVTLGGRVLYDLAAVPDKAMSLNNYDANELILTGLVAGNPWKPLTIGLSGSYHVVATREVNTSGFGVTLGEERNEDRWFYPHANGTYSGSIFRLGVQAKVEL